MAKDNKQSNTNPAPGKVLELPKRCKGEGCSKKDTKAGFCEEHYMWFKEGMITKEGVKASDFDKKWQALQRRKAA